MKVKSVVKVMNFHSLIRVDKAKKEPENAIIHTYETKDNVLVIEIKHDEEKVIVFKIDCDDTDVLKNIGILFIQFLEKFNLLNIQGVKNLFSAD